MKTSLLISFAAAVFTATVSLAADVRDGLVSYWPLDTINGSTTPDAAFTNTMTVQGSPAISPGPFGNAFTFVGPNTYLTNLHSTEAFVDSGLPIYRAGAYTICLWVKGTNQTAKYLYSEGNVTTNTPIFILQTGQSAANNAKFDVVLRNDGNTTLLNHVVSSSIVFDDTWHHLAWVDDNGNARLYVDGRLDAANFNYTRSGTFSFSSSVIGTLVRTTISTGAIFNGQIDDVAIWERVLSQAEIDSVRTNSIPLPIVPRPPSLYGVPTDVTRQLGDWALFSITAAGNRPNNLFTYQWFKNDSPISDATNRTYQTPHLTPAESGDYYSVYVTNAIGWTNSPKATVTVLPDPAPDVRNGLANYWPLDEISQVDTNLMTPDLYSHTDFVLMNFLGTTDFVPGWFSNALAFDFVSKFAYRTNGSAVSSGTNYSVAMWVQADYTSQNDRRVFSEGAPTNNNPLFTLGTDNAGTSPSASVLVRSDSGVVGVGGRRSTRPVFDNMWHHLVWTDANGQARLYVDGVLDETDYTYARGVLTVSQTSIGAVLRGSTVGNYYFGNIDEVATWNRAITWTEIQQIMTQGVPPPISAIAPSIAIQPVDLTNNVFTGDTVSFAVAANGTLPLHYQWWKDEAPISGALNPSANTDILVLNNAQLIDNGGYGVVITNIAGAVTSRVAQLVLQPFTPATSGEVLKIDIGLAGSPNLQPGFDEFNLNLNGTNFNGVGVTLTPIGGTALAARNRIGDPFVTNNPPALTQAQIYNDFVFGGGNVAGNGLSVLVQRLAPNTPYGVTIWSFDPASTGARVANWTETASGVPVDLAFAYTFYATNLPTSDYQYTFGGLMTSSPSGKLQFEGRRNSESVNAAGNADIGVFINAIRLVARPTGTLIRRFEFTNPNLRLHVVGDYPGQPIEVEQSPSLAPAAWSAAVGATPVLTNGPLVVFEIPTSPGTIFLRAKSHPIW